MHRFFYTLLIYILLPFTPLRLLWRGLKQPEYKAHLAERYGIFSQSVTKPVIWLHCVSVGETRAAEPLVKALLTQYPDYQILMTHGTPTGRETSTQLFGDNIMRAYLPYDAPFAVKRFLRHFKPKLGIIMETELWFNLIAACKQSQTPLALVNARLSEKSAKSYAKFKVLSREGLQSLSVIAAQTPQDAARLLSLGAPKVEVLGNLKFDVNPPAETMSRGNYLRNLFGAKRPVFLAASTRDGEEALILDAITAANIPNLLTVIVPRHPQRFDEVAELLNARGISFCRRSEFALGNVAADIPDNSVVLGDSMGELLTYYAACDVALIGGSLLAFGGQNLLEACAIGKPVLIGAHTFNFADASKQAVAVGAAMRIKDVPSLNKVLSELMLDTAKQQKMGQAGLKFVESSRGATQKTLNLITKVFAAV